VNSTACEQPQGCASCAATDILDASGHATTWSCPEGFVLRQDAGSVYVLSNATCCVSGLLVFLLEVTMSCGSHASGVRHNDICSCTVHSAVMLCAEHVQCLSTVAAASRLLCCS
jgi:hypothetical protein